LGELEAFRKTHYRAANSALIITGGFDMELAVQYIEAFFGKPRLRDRRSTWQEPRATAPRVKAPEPVPGPVRYVTEVDKKKNQTDVTIAFPLSEVYGDDHAALAVMAEMLNFRVGAVRHELGASYGVYAALSSDRPRVVVGGALDSKRAGAAMAAIHAAIKSLRDGEDFDRQFAFARRNVLSSMINAQGDPKLLAGQIAQAVQNGRSYEYFRDLARKVAALTPKEVQAQFARVMRDDRSVTLIQGPASGIENIIAEQGITGAKKLPEVVHDDE
jgi:predicted Zn-dependent peptidase